LEIPLYLALQTPDFSPCVARAMMCNLLKLLTRTVLQGLPSFGWVDFRETFDQVPVVATFVISFNEENAVCCRLRNIDTTGFGFCMREQELNPKSHASETISYIAWEPSSGTINGTLAFEL